MHLDRAAAQLLRTIASRIVADPENPRLRRIKLSNPKFASDVWSNAEARQILLDNGFQVAVSTEEEKEGINGSAAAGGSSTSSGAPATFEYVVMEEKDAALHAAALLRRTENAIVSTTSPHLFPSLFSFPPFKSDLNTYLPCNTVQSSEPMQMHMCI